MLLIHEVHANECTNALKIRKFRRGQFKKIHFDLGNDQTNNVSKASYTCITAIHASSSCLHNDLQNSVLYTVDCRVDAVFFTLRMGGSNFHHSHTIFGDVCDEWTDDATFVRSRIRRSILAQLQDESILDDCTDSLLVGVFPR